MTCYRVQKTLAFRNFLPIRGKRRDRCIKLHLVQVYSTVNDDCCFLQNFCAQREREASFEQRRLTFKISGALYHSFVQVSARVFEDSASFTTTLFDFDS